MGRQTLAERQVAQITAKLDPEPGPAEAWFAVGLVLGAAVGAGWLAWVRYWWRLCDA